MGVYFSDTGSVGTVWHVFFFSNLQDCPPSDSRAQAARLAAACNFVGDLWTWLQLMWLRYEVVRGPVGVVWGRLWAGLGPKEPQTGPKATPNDPDRTLNGLKLHPRELQTHR